jgi:hypothetical protein
VLPYRVYASLPDDVSVGRSYERLERRGGAKAGARSMRMMELRDGAIARAAAMFHSDRAPWCPELF